VYGNAHMCKLYAPRDVSLGSGRVCDVELPKVIKT
jgi:hypothetical protein